MAGLANSPRYRSNSFQKSLPRFSLSLGCRLPIFFRPNAFSESSPNMEICLGVVVSIRPP